jgi:hypothetical protein
MVLSSGSAITDPEEHRQNISPQDTSMPDQDKLLQDK